MSKHCKGCFSFVHSDVDHFCSYLRYNDTGKCPCCTCIVKVMCTEPCSNFLNFRYEYTEILKDEYTTGVIQEIIDG